MKNTLNAIRQFLLRIYPQEVWYYSSEINILSLQSLYQGRFEYLQEKSYSLLLKIFGKVGIRGEVKRQGKTVVH